jgi:2-oxoglutarate ferredoxin oxidoreductase subunit gamma
MDAERIIIAGFGGQGVMMLGKLLAHAGMVEGRKVSWLPSYGPEMRGGTANCHVIISDQIIGAPIITAATCVIAMNLPSLDKFEAAVRAGGRLLLNSSLIPRTTTRQDVRALAIPVNDLASQQGSLKVANVVMLGAYIGLSQAVQKDTLIEVLKEILGSTKQHLLDINLNALEAGLRYVTPFDSAQGAGVALRSLSGVETPHS